MKTKFLLFLSLALGATISCMERQFTLEQSPLWQKLPAEVKHTILAYAGWQSLPVELRQQILSYVANAKNVTELIKNLNSVMATDKELYGISQAIIHEFTKTYVKENEKEAMEEFFRAIKNDQGSVVKALIDGGLNVKDGVNTVYAFGLANSLGANKQLTKLLIDRGLNVNAKDEKGLTPLMRAAIQGHPKIIELLLKAGADINAKDNLGNTALKHVSEYTRLHPVAEALIKAGASR